MVKNGRDRQPFVSEARRQAEEITGGRMGCEPEVGDAMEFGHDPRTADTIIRESGPPFELQ